MKVLTSYGYKARYDFIPNPYSQIYEYFFLQEDDIFSIYTIRLSDDRINLFYKFIIDDNLPKDNILSFMNQKYLWLWFVDNQTKKIFEILIDIDKKARFPVNQVPIDLIDDLPLSIIERRGTVNLFSVEKDKNILFRRQIHYNLTSSVYYLTEKDSFAVLPDLNEYKFDKLSLIVKVQSRQYL